MCQAFSCIVTKNGDVKWKFGLDSHDEILKHFDIPDQDADKSRLKFARVEVAPNNGNYLFPDKWTLRVDERIKPEWFTKSYELFVMYEHAKWLSMLDKILIRKEIIHPFKINHTAITSEHLVLLKTWNSVWSSVWSSVWNSVRISVGNSVWDSVWDSVWNSVRISVGNSVWDSVGDSAWDSAWISVRISVWDSVWAYVGSFFNLHRSAWKYTESIKHDGYPFEAAVKLWEQGLVPSFDGKFWRLHGGEDAKVLWRGTVEDIDKFIRSNK